MRKILDAVLNPPEEPEIVVTEEMAQKGLCAFFFEVDSTKYNWTNPQRIAAIERAYRAMRRLEPKGETTADAVQHSVTERCHRRVGDPISWSARPIVPPHSHHRKDDAK